MSDELKTVNVKGLEVLRPGTYTGLEGGPQTYTAKDIREFADGTNALIASGWNPTSWLGHRPKKGSGLPEPPAVGLIAKASVSADDGLLLDLTDVPIVVARLMKVKAYGSRSIEGVRLHWAKALELGGRKYRQALTGLALLGKNLPAVNGLADLADFEELYHGREEDADWTDVPLMLAKGDDADPVDEILAGLDAWAELAMEQIKGRTYAPALRQRVRMLRDDFRRIAGGTTRVEAQMDLRKTLKLAAEASDEDVVAAIVKLAGAADPATALAVIAEILGVPDADPAALVAKVREMAGGGAAPAPEEEPAMGSGNVQNQGSQGGESDVVAKLQARLAKLEADQVTVLKQTAELIGDREAGAAAGAVDKAIKAGKFFPAQRETLIQVAKLSMKDFEELVGKSPVVMHLGLKGVDDAPDTAAFEPSAEEVRVSMGMGMTREEAITLHRTTKAAAAGVTLPAKKED